MQVLLDISTESPIVNSSSALLVGALLAVAIAIFVIVSAKKKQK